MYLIRSCRTYNRDLLYVLQLVGLAGSNARVLDAQSFTHSSDHLMSSEEFSSEVGAPIQQTSLPAVIAWWQLRRWLAERAYGLTRFLSHNGGAWYSHHKAYALSEMRKYTVNQKWRKGTHTNAGKPLILCTRWSIITYMWILNQEQCNSKG
jgi:hypothetical protein